MDNARIALAIKEVGAGDGVVMSSPETESESGARLRPGSSAAGPPRRTVRRQETRNGQSKRTRLKASHSNRTLTSLRAESRPAVRPRALGEAARRAALYNCVT